MINTSVLMSTFDNELKSRKEYLTEDSVRYIFFKCMQLQDPVMDHYILELPFSMMDGKQTSLLCGVKSLSNVQTKELDLFYDNGSQCICVEFKFHRNPLKKTDYAHTDAAGSIFNDINRLGQITSFRPSFCRMLVYVTDDEMHNYFTWAKHSGTNKSFRNDLKIFYDLPVGACSGWPTVAPKTFSDASTKFMAPLVKPTVVKLYNDDFISSCCSFMISGMGHIRIYEVNGKGSALGFRQD